MNATFGSGRRGASPVRLRMDLFRVRTRLRPALALSPAPALGAPLARRLMRAGP